jgi:hypothetical protein
LNGELGFKVTNAVKAKIKGIEAAIRCLIAQGPTLTPVGAFLDFNMPG